MAQRDRLMGERFGRLLVVADAGTSANYHSLWLCECDCGKMLTVFGTNLKRLHTSSCGCLNTEVITKHGKWMGSTYQSWRGMIQRCTNPKAKHFGHYGGRGIAVCPEWRHSFTQFLWDMGERPKGYSIDRIDVNKGYCKENCRWATQATQVENRRKKEKV